METGLHAEDRKGEKAIVSMQSTQNKQLGLLSDPFLVHLVMGEKGESCEIRFYSGGQQWI